MADSTLMITIGATVAGALAGLGNVQSRIAAVGDTIAQVNKQQQHLGGAIAKHTGSPAALAALQRQYDKLGASVEKLKQSEARLTALQEKRTARLAARQELKSEAFTLGATVAGLALPVKLAVDYESALADVKKVMDFETPQGFKKLGTDLLELTRTLPLAATDLAAIAASGGQLGVAEKDIKAFTITTAKMATAFDMPAEATGDAMAKLANVYKIPIASIGKLGDAINELSNKSPAKASDIVNTLSRVGGVSKQFGLTELQTASLSNAFISLGKPPEVAGTAINGMLTKLATADKQGKKFQRGLASMGLSASALKKAIGQDAQGALVGFLGQVAKLPKDQQMGTLVDLFGLEYADDVAVLTGSLKTYTDSIEVLQQKGQSGAPSFLGSMDKEFQARAATTANAMQIFKNGLAELGVGVGGALLPALNGLMAGVLPVVHSMTRWAQANPELVSGIMKALGALLLFKTGSLAARFGLSYLLGGLGRVATAGISVVARWHMAAALIRNGAGAFTVIGRVMGLGETWALRLGKAFSWLGSGAAKWGRWALSLGRVLGGGLLRGLRLAGQAVLWLGRALLMNPIGLAITAIALGAYLIYRYWDPIKGFFGGLWTQVKTAFNGGLLGIGKLIVNWSPTGLFYKAFAGVLRWFGVQLPADFTSFGGMILDGLLKGVTNKLGAAKKAIVGFGENIKDWFKGALGINSPSKVFMGFGAGIGSGASIGILNSLPGMQRAVGKLAGVALAGAAMTAVPAGAGFAGPLSGAGGVGGSAGSSGAIGAGGARGPIVFSPTIHVSVAGQGAASSVQGQVTAALQGGMAEFERMMQRYLDGKNRTSF